MVRYFVLGTGSCGNCYVFTYGNQSIMVDAGYSYKQLTLRAQQVEADLSSVKALFLTHLHPDHAHAAGVFGRKTGNPVYVSKKAQSYATTELLALNIPEQCQKALDPGEIVSIGPFDITCFYTSHDSAGSVGYQIRVAGKSITIVTDTGVYSPEMVGCARNSDLLFLESNYDSEMLRNGPYPLRLQKRVAGERGHLSNDQAHSFLMDCGYDLSQKPVYLIHLSENNNSPDLVVSAMAAFNAVVCERGKFYSGVIDD